MKLLLLSKFNNYFNRKVKLYTTTADYKSESNSYLEYDGLNFNPNDGIRTTHIIGNGSATTTAINSCDYLVCYNTSGTGESGDPIIENIVSRWFIIESVRTRAGQYQLTLKRDTIADNFNSLITCPAYIKKGVVDESNPLILNSEGIQVNQIKSDEKPLKDASNSSWIVGYMAKNAPSTSITVQIPDEQPEYETIEDIASEFGVSAIDLSAALTEDNHNPSVFINDNIEVTATIDYPGLNYEDRKVNGGSSNFLQSFTYGRYWVVSGNTQNDVLRFQNWSGVEAQSNVRTALKNYWISALDYYKSDIKSQWKSMLNHPFFTKDLFNKLNRMAQNNTLVLKQSKYYRIRLGDNGVENVHYEVNKLGTVFANVVEKYKNDYNTWASNTHYDPTTYIIAYVKLVDQTAGKVLVYYNELTANFYLEEVTDLNNVSATLSSTRNALLEENYDMFAIPASNTTVKINANTYEAEGSYAQRIAIELAKQLVAGDHNEGNVYDVQLLPYCPIPEICSNGVVDITSLTVHQDYDLISYTGPHTEGQENSVYASSVEYEPSMYEGSAIWQSNINYADVVSWGYTAVAENQDQEAQEILREWEATNTTAKTNVGGKAKFSVYAQIQDPQTFDHADINVHFWVVYNVTGTINKSVILYPKRASFSANINEVLTLKDSMKIEANCNNYRIVSPNYQGSFDFNVAKNGGSVNGFIAECTYKPFTPYIKVTPNFALLYGTNYGDCRGLICGGDFSIGLMNDKWQEYQLQNKNYQNIFNREIQNLDVSQSIQREKNSLTNLLGIGAATYAGAQQGFSKGGESGAILGGLGGLASSSILAGIRTNQLERTLNEQRQYAIDKFNMSLANIQALPYTLTKVTSFDINSKIWPFLEYYTCTEQEKEALRMKIQYEGMTLGIVDTLDNYLLLGTGNYLQADLIRNDAIAEDSHTVEDIYTELTKGVYL